MRSKVEELYHKAYELMHLDDGESMVYADDFIRLNREIYELINLLLDKRGKTVEEEARICLSLLMGLSVCMYADAADETKQEKVEERIEKLVEKLDNSELIKRLFSYFDKMKEFKLSYLTI